MFVAEKDILALVGFFYLQREKCTIVPIFFLGKKSNSDLFIYFVAHIRLRSD